MTPNRDEVWRTRVREFFTWTESQAAAFSEPDDPV